jgi:hypothetical protein
MGGMNRLALVIGLLSLTACRSDGPGAPPPDGAPPGSRVVGNCVMNVGLCPSRYCLSQGGTFLCACADQPAGSACPQACPAGYRYHSKYSSCVPTCAALTCKTGEACEDLFGVATCMPIDGGASDTGAIDDAAGDTGAIEAGAGDTRPPAMSCRNSRCNAGESCLQNYSEVFGPNGISCGSPSGGPAECRTVCREGQSCPASRPYCRMLLPGGCGPPDTVCCANSDASNVYDCF